MRYIDAKVDEFIRLRIGSGLPVNRADLEGEFRFTTVSASKHLQKFIRNNPGALSYDTSAKCYKGAK